MAGTLGVGVLLLLLGGLPALVAAGVRRRMPLEASSFGHRVFLGLVVAAGTVACIAGVAMILLPGAVGDVIGALVGLVAAIALWQRRSNEQAALDRAIALGVQRGVPLDRLGVAFAQGRHDTLGGRAYLFAQSVHAGYAPAEAAALAGLKLTPSVRTALAQPAQAPSGGSPAAPDAASEVDDTAGPRIAAGALYIALLLLFASLLTTYISLRVLPTFREIREEFEMELPPWLAAVDRSLVVLPPIYLGVLLAMLPVAGLWWMLHAGRVGGGRWLPVLGPYYRHQQDAQALEWLADALLARRPLGWIDEHISRARIGPSEPRLRRALEQVRAGTDWPTALHQAALIDRRSLPWLAIARGEEHLAQAIREVAEARRRQAADSLSLGFKIGGPLALLFVGVPVLLFGVAMVGTLAHIILWLA